jgi:hypothetical protein
MIPNGYKNIVLMNNIPDKAQMNVVDKMEACLPSITKFIEKSFLPKAMQVRY